jgi:hypothetical protein
MCLDCCRHASVKPLLCRELQDAFSTEDIFINIHVKLQMQAEPRLSIYQILLQLQKAKNCSRNYSQASQLWSV